MLPKLTQNIPSRKDDFNLFDEHQNVSDADPQFSKSGRKDMIFGTNVFEEIFLEIKITLSKSLALRETVFGWVVIGPTDIVTDPISNLPP